MMTVKFSEHCSLFFKLEYCCIALAIKCVACVTCQKDLHTPGLVTGKSKQLSLIQTSIPLIIFILFKFHALTTKNLGNYTLTPYLI